MLYYWPGMNAQIKELVTACSICEKFKRSNQKEPLVQEETPKYPFHIVAMDLFEYAGRNYIALIDAYSNYIMTVKVQSKSVKHIIDAICQSFDKLGYPTIIKCDSSPFGSAEFDRWSNEYNIQFKFSSPKYPQSNGLAEKGVAIAKNILKRCYEANDVDTFQYRLLEYNTTPVASMHMTPSELFFGRLVKTKLPMSGSLLLKSTLSDVEIQEKLKQKKEKQKYYYDRNARSLPELCVGESVIFKKIGKEWHHGTIVKIVNDRSYIIRDSFNNHFRRNRRFIAKTKNENFNASDLLLEEYRKCNTESPDNIEHVHISPSVESAQDMEERNCNVDETVLPVSESSQNLVDEFQAAGSTSSETESEIEPHIVNERNGKRIRSGRIIRPPKRYSWD